MLTQKKIAKFYQDLEALGLKHPVAEIERKTGFSKGQISQILNRKLSPSQEFIDKFNESFIFVSRETNSQNTAGRNDVPNSAYLKLLEDNDRFFKTEYAKLLISLNKLIDQGKRSEALIKLNLEHTGNVEAHQRGVEPEVIHEQINNQIVGMGPTGEMGNGADTLGTR